MKSIRKNFLALCLAISGVAVAQGGSKDGTQDSTVLATTRAASFNQESACATTSKPLPPNKKGKQKPGTKNGRA
jgi:hypothetical protein